MDFKSEQKNLTFSDLEKSSTDKKNRSKESLKNMEKAIAWDKIESILLRDYPVGDKKDGNKAYSPLLLFKCLLIQKWFRIKSDPELESQIRELCKNSIEVRLYHFEIFFQIPGRYKSSSTGIEAFLRGTRQFIGSVFRQLSFFLEFIQSLIGNRMTCRFNQPGIYSNAFIDGKTMLMELFEKDTVNLDHGFFGNAFSKPGKG
ncbi:MAG: transposase [Proteobacteria bacterium]|nr:transposase [Pseudomonadota bacterium]